jgi:hypothetical protein
MEKEAPCLILGLFFVLLEVVFERTGTVCTRKGHADPSSLPLPKGGEGRFSEEDIFPVYRLLGN